MGNIKIHFKCEMVFRLLYFSTFLFLLFFWFVFKIYADKGIIKKGKYLFQASGGCSCHTNKEKDGNFLAGGRSIKTPYGIFFSTNITPDIESGIGKWSDEDFIRAMTIGVGPEGKHYFPVFPYTSFQLIRIEDLLALKAYIFSISPISQKNLPHKLILPVGRQIPMMFWKNFIWSPDNLELNSQKTENWNRGAYLVKALAHCGECHTPRNILGDLDYSRYMSGSKEGPEGELAPNITPDIKTGIGNWSKVDISFFLKNGIKPNGDYSQGSMAEVIELGYQFLTERDLNAIAEYLLSLTPIDNDL